MNVAEGELRTMAILLEDANHGSIVGCEFVNNSIGLHLYNATNNTIVNCTFPYVPELLTQSYLKFLSSLRPEIELH